MKIIISLEECSMLKTHHVHFLLLIISLEECSMLKMHHVHFLLMNKRQLRVLLPLHGKLMDIGKVILEPNIPPYFLHKNPRDEILDSHEFRRHSNFDFDDYDDYSDYDDLNLPNDQRHDHHIIKFYLVFLSSPNLNLKSWNK